MLFIFLSYPIDGLVQTQTIELYSVDQIRKMMRYHGTLVAKFDGSHWRFLCGNFWVKLDNQQALEYVKAKASNDNKS